jgi:hypothetical protein
LLKIQSLPSFVFIIDPTLYSISLNSGTPLIREYPFISIPNMQPDPLVKNLGLCWNCLNSCMNAIPCHSCDLALFCSEKCLKESTGNAGPVHSECRYGMSMHRLFCGRVWGSKFPQFVSLGLSFFLKLRWLSKGKFPLASKAGWKKGSRNGRRNGGKASKPAIMEMRIPSDLANIQRYHHVHELRSSKGKRSAADASLMNEGRQSRFKRHRYTSDSVDIGSLFNDGTAVIDTSASSSAFYFVDSWKSLSHLQSHVGSKTPEEILEVCIFSFLVCTKAS